eukprot:scaffold46135_cov18-Tisochrysis_lutea.AAC.1
MGPQGAGAYGPGGYDQRDFNFSTPQGYATAPQYPQAQPAYLDQAAAGPPIARPMPLQPQQAQGLPFPAQSMPPPQLGANPATLRPPAPGPQQPMPPGPAQAPSYAGQPPPQAGIAQSRPTSAQPQQQPLAPAPVPLPRSLSRQSSLQ